MSTRAVLIAVCIVARDERANAITALEDWANESGQAIGMQQGDVTRAIGAVFDPMAAQPFMTAALHGVRRGMLAGGLHMGTRVNGRENDAIALSARSIELACKLADAAGGGQLLVSADLGTFLAIARAPIAAELAPTRLRFADGSSGDAYRAGPTHLAGTTPATPGRAETLRETPTGSAAPPPRTTLDGLRRSALIERLGLALTPHLGPIAPVMLRRLPSGRMSAREFMEIILRDVPLDQYEPVRRVLEGEIRRLR